MNKKEKEQRIKWFTLALVLFFIFLFFLLAVNLMSSGGSYSIRTSTTEDNSWWGTTHETTDYSLRGKKVTTHNCPFWDRDC